MAEIRVQKKKGIPVWVILLVLIILAVVVWALMSRRDRGTTDGVDRASLSAPAQVFQIQAVLIPQSLCA